MKIPDFKRKDLEKLPLDTLREIADKYKLEAIGRPGDKVAWVNAICAFEEVSYRQWKLSVGLNQYPDVQGMALKLEDMIEQSLNDLGEPTLEQFGLIRAYTLHSEEPDDPLKSTIQRQLVARFALRDALYTLLKCIKREKYQV